MIKLKNGFRFKINNQNVTGEIDGETTKGILSVVFYMNDCAIKRYDVYESTIIHNLENGFYKEV